MSDIFFNQLATPRPDIQLDIHGGGHGAMMGRVLTEVEQSILEHKPGRILVYGHANSTLAGALAAAKLIIPVAHVEAGLRSFNMTMPEEVNRILTDQISDLLFCLTDTGVKNLENEGFLNKPVRVMQVGDVMQDADLLFSEKAVVPAGGNLPGYFILATLNRAESTDNPERLASIVSALNQAHFDLAPVVLPLHPRTRKLIAEQGLELNVHLIDPVGYFEMVWLLDHCGLVLTDSGGMQKDAIFFGKACVTMRDQAEWIELVEAGANELVGTDTQNIISAASRNLGRQVKDAHQLYGGGEAAQRIVDVLVRTGV